MKNKGIALWLAFMMVVCLFGAVTANAAEADKPARANPFGKIDLVFETNDDGAVSETTDYAKTFSVNDMGVNTSELEHVVKLSYELDLNVDRISFVLKIMKTVGGNEPQPIANEEFGLYTDDLGSLGADWLTLKRLDPMYWMVTIQNPDLNDYLDGKLPGRDYPPRIDQNTEPYVHRFLLSNINIGEDCTYTIEISDDLNALAPEDLPEGMAEGLPGVSGETSGEMVPVDNSKGVDIEHVIATPSSSAEGSYDTLNGSLNGTTNVSRFMMRITNFTGKKYDFKDLTLNMYLLLPVGSNQTIEEAALQKHKDVNGTVSDGVQAWTKWTPDSGNPGWVESPFEFKILPLDYPIEEEGQVVANAHITFKFTATQTLQPSNIDNKGIKQYNQKTYAIFTVPNSQTLPLAYHANGAPIQDLYLQGNKVEDYNGIQYEYTKPSPIEIGAGTYPGAITAAYTIKKLIMTLAAASLDFMPIDKMFANANGQLRLVEKGRFQARLNLALDPVAAAEMRDVLQQNDEAEGDLDVKIYVTFANASIAGATPAPGFELVKVLNTYGDLVRIVENGNGDARKQTLEIDGRLLLSDVVLDFVMDMGTGPTPVETNRNPMITVGDIRLITSEGGETEEIFPEDEGETWLGKIFGAADPPVDNRGGTLKFVIIPPLAIR